MRRSLIISLALHAAVLSWAVGVFPTPDRVRTEETPPLPVDIVTTADLTRIKAGLRDAKGIEPALSPKEAEASDSASKRKVEAKPVKAAAAPEPARSQPQPKPVPDKPKAAPKKPSVVENKQPAAKPAAKPAKPSTSPAPAATARPSKSFDADRIAALLNKLPDSGPQQSAPVPLPAAKPKPPAQGRASGTALSMTLSEIDALRARIAQCWNPPTGSADAEALRVRLRLRLNQDGTLAQAPQIMNEGGSPYFQAAAESAVRAVWQCQPYALPAAKYALWRDMVLNFDPRELFGG